MSKFSLRIDMDGEFHTFSFCETSLGFRITDEHHGSSGIRKGDRGANGRYINNKQDLLEILKVIFPVVEEIE